MIKRLLLFALLVAAGFYALFAFVGDRETRKRFEIQETTQKPGVSIQTENQNKPTEVVIRGRLEIPVRREVQLPDGSRKALTIYKLVAEDSEPADNNTQLMHRVTIQFFDIEDKGPNPHSKLIGTMTARTARVQLSQDKEGTALIAEDKQMEFEDVVLRTEENAPISNATMTLARAFAINGAKEFRIWTPTDDIPVRMVARGKDGFEITGLGMRAWIPARRGAEGQVKMEESGDFRFIVAKMPVLVRKS